MSMQQQRSVCLAESTFSCPFFSNKFKRAAEPVSHVTSFILSDNPPLMSFLLLLPRHRGGNEGVTRRSGRNKCECQLETKLGGGREGKINNNVMCCVKI